MRSVMYTFFAVACIAVLVLAEDEVPAAPVEPPKNTCDLKATLDAQCKTSAVS